MVRVCVPIASVVTVLPCISRSFSSSGNAFISQSLSRMGSWASTKPAITSIAFRTIGVLKPFTFSMDPRSAFPSITSWIPFVLTVSPIHSMNSSANSSPSIPDRRRHAVDGEAMPFFNGRYFRNSTKCFLHHLRLLRMVILPTGKPHTIYLRSHLRTGTNIGMDKSRFTGTGFILLFYISTSTEYIKPSPESPQQHTSTFPSIVPSTFYCPPSQSARILHTAGSSST